MSEDSRAARLLAALPDAVVEIDSGGRIAGWRGAAERVFGWTAEEILGRPLAELFAESAAADLETVLELRAAPALELATTCRQRDGTGFVAALSVRRVPEGAVALVKAASPEFQALAMGAGRRSNPEWDRALGRLIGSLSQLAGTDLAAVERTDTLARVLVEEARRIIPDSQVLFSLVPHDRQDSFRIIAAAGPWAEGLVGREWPRAGTVAGRAMQLRRAIETVELAPASVLRSIIEAGRISSARLVPLWTREPLPDGRDAIGVIGWYREEVRYFTPFERRLMRELSRLTSLLLQRTELSAAAARSVARLESVVETARELTRSLEQDDILRVLIDRGLALAAADRAVVLQVEGGRMTVIAGRDLEAEQPPVGAVLPVDAARTDDGRPLLPRLQEAGGLAIAGGYQVAEVRTGLEDRPVRHLAGVPVDVAGQPSLVLVFSRRRDEPFTADDVAMLETVAGIAGLHLRNAALFVEVEEADRVKTDFLNMAAHELRTPLTVVRGYLSMMSDGSFGELPVDWARPLDLLRQKCDELGRLVEELLMAARLETGRVSVNLRPVDLNDLAAQAVEAVRPLARESGARIRFEPARRPLVVAADPEHLRRALDALVANALTYSDDEPWIRVRVRAVPGGRAEVEVEDRGRGIELDQHEAVFERFVRGAADVRAAGTGLGLYIARELVQRQGGELQLAWSEPEQGSRFVLSLPELEESGDA